jgi:hypothetical protein
MTSGPVRLNLGDWLHLLQIAVLFASLGVAFAKYQATEDQVNNHTRQLNRIEHYLSSRDPEYWQRTKEDSIVPVN